MKSEWMYKGSQRWRVETDHDNVIVEWGNVKTGKTQTKVYTAKPKNVGKINATTGAQQAEKEAQALIKKKEDSGYALKGATTNHFLPMLAKDASKIKKWPQANKYYVQPKLDGIRAIVSKEGVFSRNGKKLDFVSGLELTLEDNHFLDGEIYHPELTFQELLSKVKTGDTEELMFCCFDFYTKELPNRGFADRFSFFDRLTSTLKELDCNVMTVPTAEFTAKDLTHEQKQEIIQDIHDVYVASGYEGVMVRLDKPYEVGKRSSSLWKYKNFKTEEYKIVDYKECKKVGEHQPYVYICETDDGSRFNVTPQYNQNDRCNEELFLVNIGKKLTVKFQELTNAGIPRFPVGVSVRDYE